MSYAGKLTKFYIVTHCFHLYFLFFVVVERHCFTLSGRYYMIVTRVSPKTMALGRAGALSDFHCVKTRRGAAGYSAASVAPY